MRRVFFDVTSKNRENQIKKNNLTIFDCFLEALLHVFIMMVYWKCEEVSDDNQDLQVKFMAKSLNNKFNWL